MKSQPETWIRNYFLELSRCDSIEPVISNGKKCKLTYILSEENCVWMREDSSQVINSMTVST